MDFKCFTQALLLVFILNHGVLVSGETCPLKASIVSIQEFKVKFKVTNGPKRVCALKWNSVMDDDYWPVNIDIYPSEENVALQYNKPVMPLRNEIKDSDYQLFEPRQEIFFKRDLTEVYSFKQGEGYTIHIVNAKILDCYTVLKRGCTAHSAQDWKTGSAGIEIEGDFKAEKIYEPTPSTFSEWIEKTSNSQFWEVYPYEAGPDASIVVVKKAGKKRQEWPDFEFVEKAHNNAVEYIKEAAEHLENNRNSDLFRTWFGTFSETNYDYVLKNFTNTIKGLSEPHTYNIIPKNLCKTEELALTPIPGKEQRFFYICPLFFDYKTTQEEKAITIAHEMTHDAVDTADVKIKCYNDIKKCYEEIECYGPERCKQLAETDPEEAIRNADNYALFAQAVYAENHPSTCSNRQDSCDV